MPDINKLVKFSGLKKLAERTATKLEDTIKFVSVANNTVSFFKTADGSGTAAFSFNFPNELVLDQLKTKFESKFTFNASTYQGAENPNLDGKPVLVIAIKDTNAAGTVTTSWSFLNMETLVDIYTAKDKSIVVDGYKIAVSISAATGNHLSLGSDGLMVDVSDKADKDTDAVENNVAVFDDAGNPVDSGYGIATDSEVDTMLNEVFGA